MLELADFHEAEQRIYARAFLFSLILLLAALQARRSMPQQINKKRLPSGNKGRQNNSAIN